MKKLLVLVFVLGLASFASADIHSPMDIVIFTNYTFGIELPSGMSSAMDGSGGYFVLTGVNSTSGILNTAYSNVFETLTLSWANYGDAGDTGLFPYGVGIWGEFRTTPSSSWTTSPDIYAYNFTLQAGASDYPKLYIINDYMTTKTLVDYPDLEREPRPPLGSPEPATIALLCLGGLMIRRRK
jgi:hypothetical protein